MKTLTWYTIKEHVGPFIFALVTITFVFILNAVFRDLGKLLSKGVSLSIILRFFGLNIAWIIALAVPMAVLVATLMAFGRMSADHEITAIKAGGINFYRLISPVLFISLLLAFGLERFNNIVLPEFNHQYRLLYRDISRKQPTLTLEEGIFNYINDDYSLLARKIDTKRNTMEDIIINDISKTDQSRTITAKRGKIFFSEVQEKLVFELYAGEIHEIDYKHPENYRRAAFERQSLTIAIPNTNLTHQDSSHRGNREKSVSMLMDDVRRERGSIQNRYQRIRAMAINELRATLPDTLFLQADSAARAPVRGFARDNPGQRVASVQRQVENELKIISSHRKSISQLLVEVHKKYSIPLTCVVFVLIGAPLGIMARQGGLAVGGGLSIIFFIIYWVFLIGGEQLADRQRLSPLVAMWLPNVLMIILGVYLMRRAVTERASLHLEKLAGLFKKKNRRQE
ncbi:LptF/LptG family permease [bacterium]|nr:LptF/LptG family permease [bacterium]